MQEILGKARSYAFNEVREAAIDEAKGIATNVLKSVFNSILPFDVFRNSQANSFVTGDGFAGIIQNAMCQVVGGSYSQYFENLHFETEISRNGEPLSDGFSCGPMPDSSYFLSNGTRLNGVLSPRPDLVIKQGGPASTDREPPAYLITEFKRTVGEEYNKVRSNGNQWNAIANYAQPVSSVNLRTRKRGHQYIPVALFVTLFDEQSYGQRQKLIREALESGVHLGVVSMLPGSVRRGRVIR